MEPDIEDYKLMLSIVTGQRNSALDSLAQVQVTVAKLSNEINELKEKGEE